MPPAERPNRSISARTRPTPRRLRRGYSALQATPTTSGGFAAATRLTRRTPRVLARSTACPRHEDSAPGRPAPHTGNTRQTCGRGIGTGRCPTATRRSPTRSPDGGAGHGGIRPSPHAPDAPPGRGPAWASRAAPPTPPAHADSRGNESRDRTTHCGSGRRAVPAPASSHPPALRGPGPRGAGPRSGTRSPRHPRRRRHGGRTRPVGGPSLA